MSGSRAILLRLSVQDADVVRTQLTQMGEAGERALQRLDAAARAVAGSGVSGPITRGGAGGSGGFGGLRNAVGQAGFQIQDFAVQVQGGTSALTALSQQGSQFLGIFGPGGAVAGALLTVGLLVTRFIDLGTQSERTRQAIDRAKEAITLYGEATSRASDIMLTAEQRSAAQEQAKRAEARATLDLAIVIEREAIARANAAAARLQADEAAIGAARRDGQGVPDMFNRAGQRGNAAAQIAQQAEQAGQRLLDLERRRRDLDNQGVNRGQGQYGPDAPPRVAGGGGGAQLFDVRGAVERMQNDMLREREALIRQTETAYERYQRRLEEIGMVAQRAEQWGNPIPAETIGRAADQALADLRRVENGADRLGQAGTQIGILFASSFEEALFSGKKLGDVMESLASDAAKLIFRLTVVEPAVNALRGALSGGGAKDGGGGFGGLLGGIASLIPGGGIISGIASLFRAEGGPVTAGMPYIVGERRPELFVPREDGFILPRVPDRFGGVNITHNFSPVIDARGATPDTLNALEARMWSIAQRANADLVDKIQRGGSLAKRVRGR